MNDITGTTYVSGDEIPNPSAGGDLGEFSKWWNNLYAYLPRQVHLETVYHIGQLQDLRYRIQRERHLNELNSDMDHIQSLAKRIRENEIALQPKSIRDFSPAHWRVLEYAVWCQQQYMDSFTPSMAIYSTGLSYTEVRGVLEDLTTLNMLESEDTINFNVLKVGVETLTVSGLDPENIPTKPTYVVRSSLLWERPMPD